MKKILLGVCGGIAAYKTAELIRQLRKSHCEVRVIMTAAATKFITPMTLQVLSGHEVRLELFSHEDEAKIDHIALARWADTILIAPASANFMAKAATGLADDLLTTVCLATGARVSFAPAMNHLMWKNPATQANLQTLQRRGYRLIAPEDGEQACGESGVGRMAKIEHIVEHICSPDGDRELPLAGKSIVVTAGATKERIDPVRYISNDSSGKMGYALAEKAARLGAAVLLVSGPTALPCPEQVQRVNIESAQQMLAAVLQHIASADWFIAAAAVGDYTVAESAPHKLKKTGDEDLVLTLVQNPDILQSVCQLPAKPFCIGFAAETEKVVENAAAKRLRKGADLIAANDVSDTNIGFYNDNNAVTLIGEDFVHSLPETDKYSLAEQILLTALDYQKATST